MQQQQEMKKMKQQAQKMSGKGSKEDKGKGQEDGEEQASNPLDLTEDMTPEEYRKALLEGMSGSVPEEYQLLKKRYYEELVQQ